MQRYNIVTKRTYIKGTQEKAVWPIVGTLVHFPAEGSKEDSFILELNIFPETKFHIFSQKPRDDRNDDQI
jgi:hypothetical protein